MLPEATQEAVAGRIGERERVVAHIGVAVPVLRVEGTFGRRVWRREPRQQGIVDAAIEMDKATDRQFLLAGKAARGLAGDATGRIIRAVGKAALAPGVVGEPLHDQAVLVRDDRDRAEMIGVEISRRQRLGRGLQHPHADLGVADRKIVGPLLAHGARILHLLHHAEG